MPNPVNEEARYLGLLRLGGGEIYTSVCMKYHIAYPVDMRSIFCQVQFQAPWATIWIGYITAAQQPLVVWLYPDDHCMKTACIFNMYILIRHLCSRMGDATLMMAMQLT